MRLRITTTIMASLLATLTTSAAFAQESKGTVVVFAPSSTNGGVALTGWCGSRQ